MLTTFDDLPSFARFLESQGDLKRVKAPVDPELEIAEITQRVVREEGPALLFESVRGSSFPLLINFFGAKRRIEWALGRAPSAVGEELKAFARDMMPPRLGGLWKHRRLLGRVPSMRPRLAGRASAREVSGDFTLEDLPALKCWPKDGGRFLTYPLVFTWSPAAGRRNVGIYRCQVFDKNHAGMHWQIERGGDFHYAEAAERNAPLPAAVVLGGDPVTLFAGVLPLPEDMDELAFAGFLRGKAVPVTRLPSGLEVPADAEFIVEGVVNPRDKRLEGPFGDHFGHYSRAVKFPVFTVQRAYRRRRPLYPAAVVGKPPQEDKYMGNAVQEMLTPLLTVMHPGLCGLWTYAEAGFHNLAVAAVRQRYKKEGLKTAFALLGQGQLSLTKCLVLVDPSVNVRRFDGVLDAVRRNFEPRRDFTLLPRTAQDTLDFTGQAMNLGSKMILDATGNDNETRPVCGDGAGGGEAQKHILAKCGVNEYRNWRDALLVVKTKNEGRSVVEKLVKEPALSSFKLVAAVGDDVPLQNDELLIWGLFCRFDCARDLVPARAVFEGGAPRYEGPLGIDATWKEGYPEPLTMDPAVVERVDRRWKEYGL